jgi:hypothetical protein
MVEVRKAMTVILQFAPETEKKLSERAAASGQSVEGYIRQLVEREVLDGTGTEAMLPSPAAPVPPPLGASVDEVLAPVREEFARSGMTEDELTAFLTEVRDQVRKEKRARKLS